MQLHVATDPFQPIARVRAFGLVVGFCLAIAVGPYLFFRAERVKTPSTPAPPARPTLRGLLTPYVKDGQFTKDVDRYLVESSPLTIAVRNVFNEFLMCIGRLQPPNLFLGRAGVLFLRSSVDASPLRETLLAERAQMLGELARRAKELGVAVVCVVVPDKANVLADLLPEGIERSAARRSVYADATTTLRSVGFDAYDFETFAQKSRAARPGELLYTRLDTHWTMEFAFRTAEVVLGRCVELGLWTHASGQAAEFSPTMPVDVPADLIASLGITPTGLFARDLSENRRLAFASVEGEMGMRKFMPPTQPEAHFALAGDSFASSLGAALVGHLGSPVDIVGVMPGKGPVVGFVDVLRRIAAGELKSRVIVWEMVERSWTEDWWRRSVLDKLR